MTKRGRPRHPDILTPREWDVLALLREGLSNPEIAERLGVSRDTVKTHVSDILGKLGVSSREEAAVWRREEHRPWWAGAFAPIAWVGKKTSGVLRADAAAIGMAGAVVAFIAVAIAIGALAFFLARDGDDEAPQAGGDVPTPSILTPGPNIIGIVNDFLILEGREFFPAIPPCTAFQAEDVTGSDANSPLEIGYLPDGAQQVDAWVSTCPDGTLYGTGRRFSLPGQGEGLGVTVAYSVAPESFPVVLASPNVHQIEEVQVSGHRGLLVVPLNSFDSYTFANLYFWVEDQDVQKAGAFVFVSAYAGLPGVRDLLLQIGESVEMPSQ